MKPLGSTKLDEPSTRNFCDVKVFSDALERLAIVSVTDIQGTIVYANDMFAGISGYSKAELLGQNHRILNSGHHPPAFFKDMWRTIAGGKIWRGEIKNRAKDGSTYWVDSMIVAIKDDRGKIEGYISVRMEFTKAKAAEERLSAQNIQIDTALNNMSRGLSMFDSEARLIVCNQLYRQIYNLPDALTQPGTPFFEIISHHTKEETGRKGAQEIRAQRKWIKNHLAKLAHGESFSHTQHLKNGRIITVVNQPLSTGGWVDLQEDITEKVHLDDKIAYMAHHDALTDLPNRVLLDERLKVELARVRRGDRLAFYLLDLDDFKLVNDTLGHQTGDQLLQAVAERLRGLIRETDIAARMGGDEFAIVQVGIAEAEAAASFARRLINAIRQPYDIGGHQVVVGASIGIALAPADGDTPTPLIRHADLALYQAKERGGGACCIFQKEMNETFQARQTLAVDLRKALAAGEIELHYQPIVALKDFRMVSVEALMRWRHPELGTIRPDVFIPLAEEIGLIVPLGAWAIRQACAKAAAWPDHIKIAVNLSPLQFKQADLAAVITDALAVSGLQANRLELEITESVLLKDSDANLAILHQLHALGIRIALDDFGTGYSSLSYLQSFPFDKIKIDRTFVKNIVTGRDALKIIRAIVMLAHSLGMTTTAEGIETREQLDAVRFAGCDEIQGYFISRAVPADDLEHLHLSDESGLIQTQNAMMAAATAADEKLATSFSWRGATRRKSLSRQNAASALQRSR